MASRTTTDPLEILLEMGVDLDNLSAEEDYLSALMEAVNTLTIKDPTDPRIAPLQLEVRNVRKKRFSEAKKTTIKPDAFFNRNPEEVKDDVRSGAIDTKKLKFTSVSIAPKQKALPTSALVPYQSDKEEEKEQKKTTQQDTKDTNLLANIAKNVTDIADTLRQQYKQKQKAARSQRTQAEQAKRKLQESKLEKSFNILGKTAEKMIKPVKSLLERIFDFLFNVFLGRFLVKFMDWFGDPKNKDKAESLIRFFADFGPKLLGLYLLFGTSIGRFLTGLAAKLIAGSAKLLIGVGKFAVTLAAKFPFLAPILAGAGLFALGAAIPAVMPDTIDAEEKKTKEAPGTKEEKLEKLREQKENISFIDRLFGVDKEIDEQIEFIETGKTKRYEGGGKVSGPSGVDKVPAMLTDGEFVMSKGAVQKFGVEQLEAMNAAGGGTNRPKVVDNTMYASVGGYVGDKNKLGKRGTPERGYSTGSLMSDPLGAVDRILGKSTGIRLPSFSGSGQKKPQPKPQPKEPLVPPKTSKQETSADQTAMSIPEKMLKSPTFRDSGVLYLRSMLGGFGGKITEQDLSKASKDELNKAIARAKTRTAGELSTAERELAEAKSKGFNAQVIAERQSVVDRLKRGEVRVEYQDYYDGKNITPAAEDAKSILGKFWAATTENGGYKVVNERYDFVDMKDPLAVLMGDSSGVSKNAKPGQPITLREKLQALHQLNPFARDMSVDMVLGEKSSPERQINNVMSKSKALLGGVADFFTLNAFDLDGQGGRTLMNPSGQKLPTAAKPKGKPQPEPSKPKLTAAQIKNNQAYAASKGKYYSSTTGKTYANYTTALKDPEVAAGAAKTKAKLSLAVTPPKVTPPPPPSIEPKVTVVPAPAAQGGDSSIVGNGSGSEVDARPTGNGNANKFKIFGITLPF